MELGIGLAPVRNGDQIARCALYPKIVKDNVFAFEAIIATLDPVTIDGVKCFAVSVGLRSLLPTVPDVHGFGCRVASVARDRKAGALNRPLIRPGETIHYRGFYSLTAGPVRALSEALSFHTVDVAHCPEGGIDEHGEIRVWPSDRGTKGARATERTEIVASLRGLMSDPQEHVCGVDEDLRELLEAITLAA